MLMLEPQVFASVSTTVSDTTVDEMDVAAKLLSGSAATSTSAYNENTAEIPTVHTRARR
jgi:hypothetical protein